MFKVRNLIKRVKLNIEASSHPNKFGGATFYGMPEKPQTESRQIGLRRMSNSHFNTSDTPKFHEGSNNLPSLLSAYDQKEQRGR